MNVTFRRLLELCLLVFTLVLYFFGVQTKGMADMGILATLLEELPKNTIAVIVAGLACTRIYSYVIMDAMRTVAMFFLVLVLLGKIAGITTGISMTVFLVVATIVISISIGLVFKKE